METIETPQPTEPKSSNPVKYLLLGILGLALLGASAFAGYWYGIESSKFKIQSAKPQPKTQSQVTPTPTSKLTPSPTLVPIVEETAEWEVYRNQTYNYSFTYPPTWTLIAPKIGAETASLSSVRGDFNTYPLHDFSVQSYKGVTEQILAPHRESTRSWVWERGYPTSKTRMVGGQDAWTLEGLMKFADGKLYWRIYSLILYKDSLYELSWWDTPSKLEQQTFDQILSTFKLLEQGSPSSFAPMTVGATEDLRPLNS